MAKYQLTEEGVRDTEAGGHIPNDPDNRHWQEYQEWLTDGGVPDPAFVKPPPSDEQLLTASDEKMIRAIDWMLEYLVGNGTIQLADIPTPLKDLYVERKAQREAVGSPQV